MNKLYWDESIQLVPSMKKKKKPQGNKVICQEERKRAVAWDLYKMFEEHLIKYLKLNFVYILIYIYNLYNI